MFRCQLTGEISLPKEKPVRVVVKTRNKKYEHRYKNEEGDVVNYTTEGFEIVKEVVVRPSNVHLLTGEST